MFNWKSNDKKKKTNLEMQEPDRYYKQVVALQNQKKINISLLTIIILLIIILGKITFFYQTRVFIVEKDHNNYTYLGNVHNLTKQIYNPSDKDLIYFMNKITKNMRFLPADNVVLGKNRQELNYYLSPEAKQKLLGYDKEFNLVNLQKKGVVMDIVPISAIRLSAGTFQLRWVEKMYDVKGAEINSNLMVGIFKYKIEPPTSSDQILNNPLGINIINFSITQEK